MRFPATKFREGYDQNGVDNLLDKVAAALLHDGVGPPPLHWRDVAATRFTVTKFREGYDRDDVDTFLKRVVAELQRRERGRSV